VRDAISARVRARDRRATARPVAAISATTAGRLGTPAHLVRAVATSPASRAVRAGGTSPVTGAGAAAAAGAGEAGACSRATVVAAEAEEAAAPSRVTVVAVEAEVVATTSPVTAAGAAAG